jgi:small conductance mechanosensitive channel
LHLSLGVAYGSNLDRVIQTVQAALAGIPGVIANDPAPQVIFQKFGEFSIDLTAYFWIDQNKIAVLDAQDQSVRVIKTAFEHAGIVIPYGGRRVLVAPSET